MAIVGFCLAASHLLFLVLLVTWFSLNKPESWAQVKTRMRAALRGKPRRNSRAMPTPPLRRPKTL
jgi:hypothetical protein